MSNSKTLTDARLQPFPREGTHFRLEDRGFDSECWIWLRCTTKGYGKLYRDGRQQQAHRYMYEQLRGPVPEGLQIDHLCCERSCINPWHLEPVTGVTNIHRSVVTKLSAEQVLAIREDCRPAKEIAEEYGITPQHASRIRSGQVRYAAC